VDVAENGTPPSVRIAGRTIRGKYRVERVLGAGGMGIVVLAHHLKLDQRVAIKMLGPRRASGPAWSRASRARRARRRG
jgi:serine/threonine-protein kinase